MQNYRTLAAWQRARALAGECYRVTRAFPIVDRFALTSQIRRAAISIGGNIAEGCGRDTQRDLARFLSMAMGSACELESHLTIAADVQLIDLDSHRELPGLMSATKRTLAGLQGSVRSTIGERRRD